MLSIVICTYNRAEWLRGCLSSLEPQSKDESVEVLIVDNNSLDGTLQVAREYEDRMPNFRYVFEKTQGLSYARNRAIDEARGEYIAYLDDDAKAHPDWIAAIKHFFKSYPDASGVGGPYEPFSIVPIPEWFPKEYGRWSLGDKTRPMGEQEWINGMNMAFKKRALVEIGGFDTMLGMTGNKLAYGEETNLMLKMRERGMHIYYCAEMRVDHAILPHKLKLSWMLRSHFANGYDYVRTIGYQGGWLYRLLVLCRQMIASTWHLIISDERHFKTKIYRSMAPLFWQLGFLAKLLGL